MSLPQQLPTPRNTPAFNFSALYPAPRPQASYTTTSTSTLTPAPSRPSSREHQFQSSSFRPSLSANSPLPSWPGSYHSSGSQRHSSYSSTYSMDSLPHSLSYPHHVDMDPMDDYDDEDDMVTDLPGRQQGLVLHPHHIPHSASLSTGPSSSSMNGKDKDKQVRRRSSKACDQCRKSKCKCERSGPGDSDPCKSCVMLGTPCTFLGPSRKRGPPKGYIDAIESRLHQTEALVGIIIALATPHPASSSESDAIAPDSTSGNSGGASAGAEAGASGVSPPASPTTSGAKQPRMTYDTRAASLLADLRASDPLAREIIDRVDRGAYGVRGRRGSAGNGGDKDDEDEGKEGKREGGKSGTTNVYAAGPPPSVQGRGRMVGLGQEMEMGGLINTHPSNEWQDTVTERIRATAPNSSMGPPPRPSLSIFPPGNNALPYGSGASVTPSLSALPGSTTSTSIPIPIPSPTDERDRSRQRRRVEQTQVGSYGSYGSGSQHEGSPERRHSISPALTHAQSHTQHRLHARHSIGSFDTRAHQPSSPTIALASRYSPPVAPLPPYSGTRMEYSGSVGQWRESQDGTASHVQAPSLFNGRASLSGSSSIGLDARGSISNGVDAAAGASSADASDEETLTDAVGQLSLNEDSQVRFHGKASGLHLLGKKPRMDRRNEGGIWHFPKARVWPPVAPSSQRHKSSLASSGLEADSIDLAERSRLPAKDVQEHLLELYFKHVHPYLPVVHKEKFWKQWKAMHEENERARSPGEGNASRGSSPMAPLADHASPASSMGKSTDGPQPISSLLLLAMFSIAARYSTATGLKLRRSESPVTKPPAPPATDSAKSTDANTEPVETNSSSNNSDEDTDDTTLALPIPPTGSGQMWAAGDAFLERAKVILDRTYASSRPSTCQALLLMAYREIGIGAMAQSWLFAGMAVRMAQDLGMHRSADSWQRDGEPIFGPLVQQERKRIWYACVIMDKYVSTYIGRPLSIFESDYDTQLPPIETDEEHELWQPSSGPPESAHGDPTDAIPSAELIPFTPVPGRIISCFNESARLSSILAMIVQVIYAVKPVPNRQFEALELEKTLDRWYLDLPAHLRYEPSVKGSSSNPVPTPHVLTLHMQYWCAVLLLHRPFMRHYLSVRQRQGSVPESPSDAEAYSAAQKNYDLCVAAANHITSIVSTYAEHFCLKRASVFLCYYIFSAGIMHMTSIAANPSDPQARVGLDRVMDALKRMDLVWPSAGRAWELLNGAKEGIEAQGIFKPTEPSSGSSTSTDRPKKRSADDIMADVNDAVRRGDASMSSLGNVQQQQGMAPPHSMHQQSHEQSYAHGSHLSRSNSGVHAHSFVHTYASSANTSPTTPSPMPPLSSSSHHPPAPAPHQPAHESPLAFFSSYDRWTPDNQLGFPAGLSTSVLPTQYSTGFVDDRGHASSAGSGASSMHRLSVDAGASSAGSAPTGGSSRYPQYWNDYNTLGQPTSMLGSMYGMGMLPGTQSSQSTHSHSQSHTSSHGNHGHGHGHNHNHSHGSQVSQSGQTGMYMGDHYNMFGQMPPPS